jgi:hypothetical protein
MFGVDEARGAVALRLCGMAVAAITSMSAKTNRNLMRFANMFLLNRKLN